MNRYTGGLLSLGDEDSFAGESSIENMTPVEEIQAQSDESEFIEEQGQVEEHMEALESMDQIVEEGEAQVIQNEVNEAAMEGQTVPEGADVAGTVEVDGSEEVAAVAPAEEVPAPTLTQDSTPEEVGLEAIRLNNKLTNFAGRLRIGSAEDMKSYLGVNRGFGGGLESITTNPLAAYKEGCLGFKETLVKYKNKVIAFLQKIAQTIVRWFKKFINACKMTKRRAKNLKEKLKGMEAKDYEIKANSKLPGAVAWVYGYDSTGKDYISKRAQHIDDIIKKIKNVADSVLTGKDDPKTVNEKAIKKFGESDGITTTLLKKIASGVKFITGSKTVSGNDNGVKIFLPVDNEKAYSYIKYDGNSDEMDGFPKLQTVSVKQDGMDSKAWFNEVKQRLDVSMNLCNSIIAQADGMSKKMDDASKAIEKFKKDISNLVEAGNKEGEGMANRNYAVRKSISVASDLFKVSYVYGIIPSQALTAAFGLVSSLEKKGSN